MRRDCRRYLRSGFAEADLTEIFSDSASRLGAGNGSVGYLEDIGDGSLGTFDRFCEARMDLTKRRS